MFETLVRVAEGPAVPTPRARLLAVVRPVERGSGRSAAAPAAGAASTGAGSASGLHPLVEQLQQALQACAAATSDLGGAADVVALARAAEAAQAVALRSLARFDASHGYAVSHPEVGTHPHATAAAFLRQVLGLGDADSRARVAQARRLAPAGDLAALGDLVLAGRTTLRHASAVAAGVRGLDPAVVQESMPAIAVLVQHADPALVERELRERAHAVSDELAREQERRQRERRGFWLSRSTDGVGHVKGTLDALSADLLEEALARVTQRERTALDETGRKDARDSAQRRADALTTLARHALTADGVGDAGPLVGAAGVRAAVTVVVTAEQLALVKGSAPARTTSAARTALSRASLLELTCDADLSRVTLDTSAPAGSLTTRPDALLPTALGVALLASPVVLDHGRTTRTVTTAQWRALVARDRTCVRPGCTRQAAGCVAHHVRHWSRGGASDLANYVLLCHAHHCEVHQDDSLWHRHRDGRWLTPDGFRPPDSAPPDLRSVVRYGSAAPPTELF